MMRGSQENKGSSLIIGGIATVVFVVLFWLTVNYVRLDHLKPKIMVYCVYVYEKERYVFMIKDKFTTCTGSIPR